MEAKTGRGADAVKGAALRGSRPGGAPPRAGAAQRGRGPDGARGGRVNFFSYVARATAALPTLQKNKGSLVVVSSLTGEENTHSLYHFLFCHKFALDGFFSSLRHELIMQKRNVSITLCILGLIDTDMALQNTRGKVHITASPGPEAALTIIQGGATRMQEVFYPWWLQHMCCLWVLFPNDQDQVLQSYYNYSSP
uniref:Hydroxysteroid 11-beta-dehydrogenase 1-like protein n=1 Tax=Strix occidentalis caurina TaxID=311401 RepID=A0A8D0FIU7_STROC